MQRFLISGLISHAARLHRPAQALMAERILVMDGAYGTMIQRPAGRGRPYRGERFADWPAI